MASARPQENTCSACVYWAAGHDKRGECRCDPPLLFDDGETGWPSTLPIDWCGNFNDDWEGRYKKETPA